MIYFLQRVDGIGPIKVGYSARPKARLHAFQTMHPYQLHIIASFDGSFDDERSIHNHFEGDRLLGEWFNPSLEMFTMINGVLEGKSLYDFIEWGPHTTPKSKSFKKSVMSRLVWAERSLGEKLSNPWVNEWRSLAPQMRMGADIPENVLQSITDFVERSKALNKSIRQTEVSA